MSTVFRQSNFTSWGRVIRAPQCMAHPRFCDELAPLIANDERSCLAVGVGRSYGDSCLNSAGNLIDMTGLDRIIDFDAMAGRIRAEAGLMLSDLLRFLVPKGWFTATSPGTRFVTLGGAVANDVHGKNHHSVGSFGNALLGLSLSRSDRGPISLDAEAGDDLFAATIGGLGLTGVIADVTLRLTPIESAFLDVERLPFEHVRDFFKLSEESSETYEHTVSWIDCSSVGAYLGRGIFQRGCWAKDGNLQAHNDSSLLSVPMEAPGFLLNSFTVRAFNAFYYRLQKYGPHRQKMHYAPFFHPLDSIGHWNRLYGRSGFYQYQCAVPPQSAEAAIKELLRQIAKSGAGSFLAVIKTFGKIPSRGMLSFPMEGATLALDFPNRGDETLKLMSRLDEVVREAGGRLYLAKDARMSPEMFRFSYPAWERFAGLMDPGVSSDLWRRVSA